MPTPPARSASAAPAISRARKAVAGCCLAAPFLGLLAVPLYTRDEPQLAGFPFFFWYQLAWVLLTAALTTCAYLLVGRQVRRRR